MTDATDQRFRYLLLTGLGLGLAAEHKAILRTLRVFRRDAYFTLRVLKLAAELKRSEKDNLTVPKVFQATAAKFPHKTMLKNAETGEEWTFGEVDSYSNRLANLLLSCGIGTGDVVALMVSNCPKYCAISLAIIKTGATVAFINTNLREEPLNHCLKVSNYRALIFEDIFQDAIDTVNGKPHLLWVVGASRGSSGAARKDLWWLLEEEIRHYPSTPVPKSVQDNIQRTDDVCYIYTSGTTGFPKAAHIDHIKYTTAVMAQVIIMGIDLGRDDRIYCTMPLYHVMGQLFAFMPSIFHGATFITRRKFSASEFWHDCINTNATCAMYIGEMCRFLANAPPCPEETQHKLRFMYGIGLTKQVWPIMLSRFKVPRVYELYGSTEGTAGLANSTGKPGAIGFIPKFSPFRLMGLIKTDIDTVEALRDPKTGLCIPCNPGEPGELVGAIQPNDRGGPEKFKPYVNNEEATKKKLIRDVWKKGDICFRTGDIVVQDEEGWVYFQDRIGDTFRWRGENVSTVEVESIISSLVGQRETMVFGVTVPGEEGKAGMAVIYDPDEEVDIPSLSSAVEKKLPKYAQPMFIRLTKRLDLTGTAKLIKINFKKEGYDITKVTEPIFYKATGESEYNPLDINTFEKIMTATGTEKFVSKL